MTRFAAAGKKGPHGRWPVALLVLIVLIGPGCTRGDHSGHDQHRFQDAERWARAFDDPARDAWQRPDDVIRALALAPDTLVADIGSGTGYFAVRLARAVPPGRVYGADIEPDMAGYLAERGRVAIIDFLPDAPAGPPRHARIPAASVKEEMGRARYDLVTEHSFLPYQYFLIFAPQ